MTIVLGFVAGVVGIGVGHYVYDTAKLIRRESRRRRKLSSELNGE